MSRKRVRLAIDGPAGAGKSTVSRRVARELGYTSVDTGAMYRAVTVLAQQQGVPLEDEPALTALAERHPVTFATDAAGEQQVFIAGQEVTTQIRTPEISRLVSPLSAIPGVRRALVRQQQALGEQGGVVMEGRDIQTVVMPDAEVKVFLTASPEERARRRYRELQERGTPEDYDEVLRELPERDARDSSRPVAPLTAAARAVVVGTDGLSIEQVVQQLVDLVREAEQS